MFQTLEASASPGAGPIATRNALLDRAFYDVTGLSAAEIARLSRETSGEGAILVVHPNPARDCDAIRRHESYEAFRAAPGRLLRHFAVAGVGGSELGAAALARAAANRLGEPVGAIAAGYGWNELLGEALGGWMLFGSGNRALAAARRRLSPVTAELAVSLADRGLMPLPDFAWDAGVLLRLLCEGERRVRTLVGHSRGGLAVGFALQALWLADRGHFDRVKDARVVTLGAVSPLPDDLTDATQYLGAADWLGALNSDLESPRVRLAGVGHHLNPAIRAPAAIDLDAILARRVIAA